MTPEERLLRSLIAVEPRRDHDRALCRTLFRQCDPAVLTATFARDQLTPLAGGRLTSILGPTSPAWLVSRVADATASARAEGERRAILSAMIQSRIARSGTRVVPLKGSHVALHVYGDVALRRSGDIDVLVAPEDLPRAVSALAQEGWHSPTDPTDRAGLPRLHFEMRHADGLPAVEIHWRLHYYERTWAQAMLERATGRPADLRPTPADTLAALVILYARDGFSNLRLAADIAAWWDRFGDAPMPEADRTLAAAPALRRAWITGLVAAELAVGLPSGRVLGVTHADRGCSRTGSRFAVLPLATTNAQRHAERRMADPLLAPVQQVLPSIRRQFVPSARFAKHQRPVLAASRFLLAADLAASMLVAPVRMLLASVRLCGSQTGTRLEVTLDNWRAWARSRTA